jgi:hypothetical protein
MFSMAITAPPSSNRVEQLLCSSMEMNLSDGVFSLLPRCSVREVCQFGILLIVERTGKYVEYDDHIPISGGGSLENDKLLGVSVADFAIAIVDEAETEKHVFKHWTVTSSLEDDTPTPSYVTL